MPTDRNLTPISPELQQQLIESYTAGTSMLRLATQHAIPYARLRQLLVAAGVEIRAASSPTYGASGESPASKLTADAKQSLLAELQLGQEQHVNLAKKYGVSRERVRQIAKSIGAPTGREVQHRRTSERKSKRQEDAQYRANLREQMRRAKYQHWNELWERGLTMNEMAQALGQCSAATIGVRITELRRRYPGWFKLRRGSRAAPIAEAPVE